MTKREWVLGSTQGYKIWYWHFLWPLLSQHICFTFCILPASNDHCEPRGFFIPFSRTIQVMSYSLSLWTFQQGWWRQHCCSFSGKAFLGRFFSYCAQISEVCRADERLTDFLETVHWLRPSKDLFNSILCQLPLWSRTLNCCVYGGEGSFALFFHKSKNTNWPEALSPDDNWPDTGMGADGFREFIRDPCNRTQAEHLCKTTSHPLEKKHVKGEHH